MGAKIQNQNKLMRAITMPLRALVKVRDFYVRSVTRCAAGGAGYHVGAHHEPLPRSFSLGSSRHDEGDDFKELMRAASARSMEESISMDLMKQRSLSLGSSSNSHGDRKFGKAFPKSFSVGMGRIDEELAYDDDDDDGLGGGEKKGLKRGKKGLKNDHQFYGRSKTYAAPTRNNVVI